MLVPVDSEMVLSLMVVTHVSNVLAVDDWPRNRPSFGSLVGVSAYACGALLATARVGARNSWWAMAISVRTATETIRTVTPARTTAA